MLPWVPDRTAEPPTLSPGERGAIRAATYEAAENLICHLRVADYTEGREPTYTRPDPYGDLEPEFRRFMMSNAAKPRYCREFWPFRPGRSPRLHIELRHDAEKTSKEH
jgi:hypothetical protein